MDPIRNPYAPGAGTPPPELAGRGEVREKVRVAIARVQRGYPAKSVLLIGLRGVGKTVLLDQMKLDADQLGHCTIRAEVPENRSLPALLAPQLRLVMLRLSKIDKAKEMAQKALRALAGFAKALKVVYSDIEVGIDFEPEPGLADNGDLEGDLTALLAQAGEAARNAGVSLVLFVDELQYVEEAQFGALISALHRCSQLKLPVLLIGAGLPQLRGVAGNAKSYAERLFDFVEIGALAKEEAADAIVIPAEMEGVSYEEAAVDDIVQQTAGYPYFLQEWGKHAWEAALESPITVADVMAASGQVIATLDESFFRVRFDRLTQSEKRYLRAMAELGPGPHRSGSIAEQLGRNVSSFAPVRASLIAKGMVWSPNHGDTAFTVPLFDEFMRRIMPKDD